jgi:hypothetical protein
VPGPAPIVQLVLGDPRVFADAPAGGRLELREDGAIVGIAALEPLFGPHAEAAMSLVRPTRRQHALRVAEAVLDQAREQDLKLVRFTVVRGQTALAGELAALLPGARLRSGRLEIRTIGHCGSGAARTDDRHARPLRRAAPGGARRVLRSGAPRGG